jgi:hypothetical protein
MTDRLDPMQAAGRIDDEVAGWQFHLVLAAGVAADQLAAIVGIRFAEERRAGNIAAQLADRGGLRHDRATAAPVSMHG